MRTRSCNIVIHLSGPIAKNQNVSNEIERMNLFVIDNILELITEFTNIYIDSIKHIFQRERMLLQLIYWSFEVSLVYFILQYVKGVPEKIFTNFGEILKPRIGMLLPYNV